MADLGLEVNVEAEDGRETEQKNKTESTQSSESSNTSSASNGCPPNQQTASRRANRPCRGTADPAEIVLAATALALALSKGKNRCEIETLVNLFSLTTSNLQAILVQMAINQRAPNLDIVV